MSEREPSSRSSLSSIRDIAGGYAKGILRFLPLRGYRDMTPCDTTTTEGDADSALLTICKMLQERATKGQSVDEAMFIKLVQIFSSEVGRISALGESEKEEIETPQSALGAALGFGRKTKAQQREERHLYLLQVVRLLCKSSPHLVAALGSGGGLKAIRDLTFEPVLQTKVTEAAGSLLLDLFSDFPEETLEGAATPSLHVTLLQQEGISRSCRGLQIVYHLLKRWDAVPSYHRSAATLKAHLFQSGAVEALLEQLRDHAGTSDPSDPTVVAHSVLTLSVVGGCMRGAPAVREWLNAVYGFPKYFELWLWVVRRMDVVTFADVTDRGSTASATTPLLQRVNSFDSSNGEIMNPYDICSAWLGEVMDALLESSCTGASFAIERQLLQEGAMETNTPGVHTPRTPRGISPRFSSPSNEGAIVVPRSVATTRSKDTPGTRLLQWNVPGVPWGGYPASLDFDVTSNATVLWRCVCALSRSIAIPDAILHITLNLHAMPDQAMRFVLILMLLLCRATPSNAYVFATSGCIDVLLRLFKEKYQRTQPMWQLIASILSGVAQSHLTSSYISAVFQCMEEIAAPAQTSSATGSTLDVANVVLRAIPQSTFASSYYYLDGTRGVLPAGVVEKWPGTRTGYTVHITANVSCVWQGGMTLVSIYEVSTKEVVLALQFMPWHGSKFLAVTTWSKQQRHTTVAREHSVGDGWHRISLFHHRNGITLTVDGKVYETLKSNLYPSKTCQIFLGAMPYCQEDPALPLGFTSYFFGRLVGLTIQEGEKESGSSLLQMPWTQGPMMWGVEQFEPVKASKTLLEMDVVGKATEYLLRQDVSAESKLLALRLLAVLAQSGPEGTAAILSLKGFETLDRFVDQTGPITADCVDAILELASAPGHRVFRRDADWSKHCLDIVVRILHRSEALWPDPQEALLCRAGTLRRLSDVLTNTENAAQWRSGPGLTALCRLGLVLPAEYGAGIVAVMEKLCSSLQEMELILAFTVLHPDLHLSLLMLRMLYDVCKSTPTAATLASGNPWNALLYLLRGTSRCVTSEYVRVQSIRLCALLLHNSEKQRSTFLKGTGFDAINAALLQPGVELGIPTFECLFQFALDSYRPNGLNEVSESCGVSDLRYLAPPSTSPSSECAHTPSFIVVPSPVYTAIAKESLLRSYQYTQGTDYETHHEDQHAASGIVVVYPHAIRVIFSLLPRTTPEIAKSVLHYLEKVMGVPQNLASILGLPWMDWIQPVITAHGVGQPVLRAVVRSLISRECTTCPKSHNVGRLKELSDCTEAQIMVLEEFIYHISSNSRLDILDTTEVTVLLRNMELLFAIEEYLHPIPTSVALSIVHIIGAVAATSGAAIRTKMRSTKLFDLRDRIAFHVLYHDNEMRSDLMHMEALLSCCPRDPNACILLLRLLSDSIAAGTGQTPSLVTFIRTLSADDEQRKVIQRLVVDMDVMDKLVSGQREVTDFVETATSSPLWSHQITGRIVKAYAVIESEMAARGEKREKAIAARLKTRKTEEDKKQMAVTKAQKEEEDRRGECLVWGREKAKDVSVVARDDASLTTGSPEHGVTSPQHGPDGITGWMERFFSKEAVSTNKDP